MQPRKLMPACLDLLDELALVSVRQLLQEALFQDVRENWSDAVSRRSSTVRHRMRETHRRGILRTSVCAGGGAAPPRSLLSASGSTQPALAQAASELQGLCHHTQLAAPRARANACSTGRALMCFIGSPAAASSRSTKNTWRVHWGHITRRRAAASQHIAAAGERSTQRPARRASF
jgi:hypothetical protein